MIGIGYKTDKIFLAAYPHVQKFVAVADGDIRHGLTILALMPARATCNAKVSDNCPPARAPLAAHEAY